MTDPKMNHADSRLEALEVRVERIMALLDAGRLGQAQEELSILLGSVRDVRTLAQGENWRLIAQYNGEFYREFLRLAHPDVLAQALRECDAETRQKIVEALDVQP